MRFAILVAGGVATGALSVGAVQTMVPQNSQMFQAVRALGGDPAKFRIGTSTRSRRTKTSSGRSLRAVSAGRWISAPQRPSPRSQARRTCPSQQDTYGRCVDAAGDRRRNQQPRTAGRSPRQDYRPTTETRWPGTAPPALAHLQGRHRGGVRTGCLPKCLLAPALLLGRQMFTLIRLSEPHEENLFKEDLMSKSSPLGAGLSRRRIIKATAALAAGIAAPNVMRMDAAFAAYPERVVKIVVANSPGGPSDIIARFMAAALQDTLGKTFIVENKGGGGGNIGMGSSRAPTLTATRCCWRRVPMRSIRALCSLPMIHSGTLPRFPRSPPRPMYSRSSPSSPPTR